MLKALIFLCFVDASRYGVVADGRTDNYDVLQKIVDMGGTIDLPAGTILTRWPIYVDKANTHIRGQGKGVTVIRPLYGQIPPFVFGVRRTENNNSIVTQAHNPDCFDILDRTIAPNRNMYRGFSTQSNSYIMAVSNPLQYGRISPVSGSRVFDGYGSLREMTVEFAMRFRGGIPKQTTFLGLGQWQNPGPWIIGTDSNGDLLITFRSKDIYQPLQVVRAPLPQKDGVYRFRVWFKLDSGIGVSLDGKPLQIQLQNVTFPIPNFSRNFGMYPFFIGPGNGPTLGSLNLGKVPDMDILALKVSNVAKTEEPANDRDRYVVDANTIYYMNGQPFRGRTIEFGCGQATAIPTCVGIINSTTGTYGGIINNSISNLTVDGGGILVGQVLDFKAYDLEAGGFVGIATYPLEMNYPITIENCIVGGYHAGILLIRSFAWLKNVNVTGSGMASMIFVGCNVSIDNAMFSHFSPEAETCILSLPDESGGRMLLRNIEVDNEDVFLPSAIKVHLAPYGPITYLDVNSLGMAQLAADRPIIDLVGTSTKPGIFNYSGLVGPTNAIPVIIGNGWANKVPVPTEK